MAHHFIALEQRLCRASSWQSGLVEAFGPLEARKAGALLRVWACISAVFVILGCTSTKMLPRGASSALVGSELPEFRHKTLRGESLHSAAFRGRPLVVKFFADYCEPCKRTLPAMERMHRERPDVAFVGVSEDDHAMTAERTVAAYALSFPVLHDAGKELSERFRIRALPATFVIDRHGVVRWVGGPEQSEHDVAEAIRMVAE